MTQINRFKQAKNYLAEHKWASILFEMSIIIIVLLLFSWFQNSGTIASEHKLAPDFQLQSIDGKTYQLSQFKGKKVLIYFFAPWCSICHMSGGNLNNLRQARSHEELEILVIGLSWENVDEIKQFAHDLELTMPVLIGSDKQIQDFKIKGFPTYFVIDEQGKVKSASVGYSTELGMRFRT